MVVNTTVIATAQGLAKRSPDGFAAFLDKSSIARRGFWLYLFDRHDFAKWKTESKKILFEKALFEGFQTITDHPKAIALTLAATTLTTFTLGLMLGSAAGWVPGLIFGSVLLALSHVAGYFNSQEIADATENLLASNTP